MVPSRTKGILLGFGLACWGALPAMALEFAPAVSLPAGISPRGVGLGDVYGKGMKSFLVANFGAPTFIGLNTPATLVDQGRSSVQVFSPSPAGLKLDATIPAALSPRGIGLWSLSGGDRQDILVTAYEADLLQVFSWDGKGFAKTSESPTLKMPVGVAAGRTRKDGEAFIAVADYGAASLSLFELDHGKLGQRTDVVVPAGPTQLAIGDLDGDGVNEVAVACLPAHLIQVLALKPGGGPSSYAPSKQIPLPEGSEPSDLRILDLNGDGRMDLAVIDFAKNSLLLFLQQGDGSLVPQAPLATSGQHPNGFTAADLDGDGVPEIIVANRDSDSLDLFQGRNGLFRLVQTLRTSEDKDQTFGPVEVAVMDSRGTGRKALVASHMRSNSIKVLEGPAPAPSLAKAEVLGGGQGQGTPFSERTTYCYPNPSHDGRLKVTFTLEVPSAVGFQVFNVKGELVWSQDLSPSQTQAGVNVFPWEGVNQSGQNLASGLYVYCLTVGEKKVTKKLAIIR